MKQLTAAMRQHGLVRFIEHFAAAFPDAHLKDLVVDYLGPNREMVVNGKEVVNFGSDSFLGLDQDPRVQASLIRGVERWGAHNGASRAFASVRANEEAEDKLAAWLGAEAALIYRARGVFIERFTRRGSRVDRDWLSFPLTEIERVLSKIEATYPFAAGPGR